MGLQLVTAPAKEPVTLAIAKGHLRVRHDSEDDLILLYMTSARQWVEQRTKRALISQTWDHVLPDFPRSRPYEIDLPLGRCSSILQITYFDTTGTQQTLTGPSVSPAGTDFQQDLSSDAGGIVSPPVNEVWPDIQSGRLAPVTVRLVAGYGLTPDTVEEALRTGLLYRLTDLYEYRGAIDGSGTESAKREVDQYRLLRW